MIGEGGTGKGGVGKRQRQVRKRRNKRSEMDKERGENGGAERKQNILERVKK